MLEASFDEGTRVLTIKASGTVSDEAIEGALDNLEARYPQVGVRISGGEIGGIGVFLDWEQLDGWETGAKVASTLTAKMLSDIVRRVAIVGPDRWRGEAERLADVAKHAETRFFAPSEREEAWSWLTAR